MLQKRFRETVRVNWSFWHLWPNAGNNDSLLGKFIYKSFNIFGYRHRNCVVLWAYILKWSIKTLNVYHFTAFELLNSKNTCSIWIVHFFKAQNQALGKASCLCENLIAKFYFSNHRIFICLPSSTYYLYK